MREDSLVQDRGQSLARAARSAAAAGQWCRSRTRYFGVTRFAAAASREDAVSRAQRQAREHLRDQPQTRAHRGIGAAGPGESVSRKKGEWARWGKPAARSLCAPAWSPAQATGHLQDRPSAHRARGQPRAIRTGPQGVVRLARRCRISSRICVRAVSQSTGRTRPSETSRERRPSSSAHAAATASSGSSRLFRTSPATRARSSRGSLKTSASSSSVDTPKV